MKIKYFSILFLCICISIFFSGSLNRVFAGHSDHYGCSYDGCGGQWTHWWCDDTGWCSVGDCSGNPVSYCSWGGCSVSCGGGIQYYTCYLQCGGSYGSGSQACNTQACCTPTNGGWSAWGSCSLTCGGGTQTRSCNNPSPSCGGAGCSGSTSQSCNSQPCVTTANAASSITATGFLANWSAAATATGYYLDVATDTGFTSFVTGYNNLNVNNVMSYSVTGLTTGITYYYRVRAYNASGTSASSNTITQITIAGIPGISPPTNIVSTSFTANWGSVTGAASYRLDVATDTGFTNFVTGYNNKTEAGTNDSVTGLSANTTYYYRVRSVNAAGTSSNSSNYIAVTTPSSGTSCPVSAGGDITINTSCTFPGQYNGADNGKIMLQTGTTLTINANQTIVWNPGQSIIIPTGANIAINSTGALSQSYLWMPVVNSSTSTYPSASTQTPSLSTPGANYKRRYLLNDVYTVVPQ